MAFLLLFPFLEARRLPRPAPSGADAVLVLAGGENRIREGVRLLREGAARDLHVLGAGRHVTAAMAVPGYDELPEELRRRVFVENWSENTLENAASAKAVVLERGYRNVVLVTSDYHVPRAARALRRVLPEGVGLTVLPVVSERREKGWYWRRPRLYLGEALKYWGVMLLHPFE